MKKIKNYIIHLLGGITQEDYEIAQSCSYNVWKVVTINELLTYAKSINGMSADRWCKLVYNKLESELEKIYNQEQDENND